MTPGPVRVSGVGDAGQMLAAESARYAALGWMRGTSGNLSVRVSADPLVLAVTASGLDKGELSPADVVLVDADGAALPDQPGPPRRPSAEARLHARIVAVTGAGAVVHLHALAAVLAADRWPDGVPLRDHELLKGLGRRAHDDLVTVPVVANSQDMTALGDAFQAAWRPDVPALLVARHGVYVWGDDLRQARQHMESLEWLLRFVTAAS